jgi:tetratricopeptide (TPR) repeat protein
MDLFITSAAALRRIWRLTPFFFLLCAHSFSASLFPHTPQTEDASLPRFVRLERNILETSVLTRKDGILPSLSAESAFTMPAVLEVVVDELGIVRNAKPVSVDPRLQEEAVRAAREWTFSPRLENGKPVFVVGSIHVNFTRKDLPEQTAIEEARTVAKENPKDAAVHLALGKLYSGATRYEEAIEALKRSIDLKRDSEEASVLLADIYGRLRRHDDQISVYTQYLLVNPDSVRVLELLGKTYMERGSYNEVISTFDDLQILKPNDASVMTEIGRAHARLDNIETAIRIYQKALEISPDSAITHQYLGVELVRIRQYKDGEAELKRAIGLNPGLRLVYHTLAGMYLITGRNQEGLEVIKSCVKNAHADFQELEFDYHLLGTLFSRVRNLTAAVDYLRQALELRPERTEIYCTLAAVQEQQGQEEEALKTIEKGFQNRQTGLVDPMLVREQDAVCLYGSKGHILIHLNRLDEAEAPLRQVMKLNPDHPGAYLSLAELMKKKEQWDEAISFLSEAQKLAPGDGRIYLAQGDIFDKSGKPGEAERALRAALRFQPNEPLVLNNLGYFLLEQDKNLNEAFKMIERAVAADPENSAYLDSLGWAYFKLGQLDQAEKYLIKSLKRRPESADVLEHLGDVLQKQGKGEMARKKWQEALAVAQQHQERSAEARLRQKLAENKN